MDVKPTAKTGYDWTGDFLPSGKLVDLEPGTLVVTCDAGGSRKRPVKIAQLYVLLDDGSWALIEEVKDNEWAYSLRETAHAWLVDDNPSRVQDGWQLRLERLGKKLVERQARKVYVQTAWTDALAYIATMPPSAGYVRFKVGVHDATFWVSECDDLEARNVKAAEFFNKLLKEEDAAISGLEADIQKIQERQALAPEPEKPSVAISELQAEKVVLLDRLAEIDSILKAAGVM
jgi:hypothetical protein